MGRNTVGVSAPASAALGPEGAAAVAGMDAAKRFWGGLIDALGKDAYDSSHVKVGRKVVARSHHALGYTRTDQVLDGTRVRTERLQIARWELVPLALIGLAGAAYAVSNVERLASTHAAISAKTSGWKAQNGGQWVSRTVGPHGVPILNFPGGIHIP